MNPEHIAHLTLNGVTVASNRWDGFDEELIEAEVLTALVPGTNTLVEYAYKVGPEDISYHYLDWYEIAYPRYYVATANELWCHGAETNIITVRGFTSTNVDVYDITDPRLPVRIRDTTIDSGTNADYRVSFRSDSTSNRYYAVAADVLRSPDAVRGRSPMDLSAETNRGDYVVIVAPGFEASVLPLLERRESQGLDVMMVPIEDVYDEYSYGQVTPWAIRSFLSDAVSSWSDVPRYVVLAGSGTYDYLNRKGGGDCTIPAPTVALETYGLRVSDAPLADLAGLGAPEVALGRFHCQTVEEMAGVVAKTMAYEESQEWREAVRFTADKHDPTAGNFLESCEVVAAQVSSGYLTETNYFDIQTKAVTHDKLVNGINSGALLVTYFGHGSPDTLGQFPNKILETSNLNLFTNATHAPVMVGMTCDFAYFGAPNAQRLGEGLVARPSGGLTALWGSTAPTYNFASEQLAEDMAEHVFSGRSVRLGDALVAALDDYEQSGTLPYVLKCMSLLGDPAVVLAPEPYSYQTWRDATFSSTNATNSVVSGPDADPDADGAINLVEFVQDSNPMSGATGALFTAYIVSEEQGPSNTVDFATLEFRRRKWIEGYELRVDRTFDLMSGVWSHGSLVSQERAVVDVNRVVEDVTTRIFPPIPVDLPLFVRLAIVEAD